MPIYHTPTQEVYDALMENLEKQGYQWSNRWKPTEVNAWRMHKTGTCINADEEHRVIQYDKKDWYESLNPSVYGEVKEYIPWIAIEGQAEEGCDVCLKGEPMVPYDNASTKLTTEGGELEVEHFDDDYGEQSDYLNINYCPMCGTKLKEVKAND